MKKPVYAVSGSIFSPTSVGTNNLIESGMAKSFSLQNIVSEKVGRLKINLNEGEQEIVTLLKIEGPMGVNEIARWLGGGVGEVLARLMKLEMSGVVDEERGIWKML